MFLFFLVESELESISSSQNELRISILEYAWSEFKRMGLKKVKVDDISSHFSISKRTLYEMFEDKETLIVECFKHHFAKKRQKAHEIQRKSKVSLEAYVRLFVERLKDTEDVNPVFFSESLKYPKLCQYFQETAEERNRYALQAIQQCVDDGYLIRDFNYKMLLEVYNVQFLNILKLDLYKHYSLHDILNTLQIVSFRGCCTQKGLELVDAHLEQLSKLVNFKNRN